MRYSHGSLENTLRRRAFGTSGPPHFLWALIFPIVKMRVTFPPSVFVDIVRLPPASQVLNGQVWVLVDEAILDVSDFAQRHPGGRRLILNAVGTDVTQELVGKGMSVGHAMSFPRHVHSGVRKRCPGSLCPENVLERVMGNARFPAVLTNMCLKLQEWPN